MTAAQLVQFLIILGLGILAFLTFLVAGTILGLMIVEDSGCSYCLSYPVGLFVLGLLWLLLLISFIRELADSPVFDSTWIKNNQEVIVIALLIFIVLLILL